MKILGQIKPQCADRFLLHCSHPREGGTKDLTWSSDKPASLLIPAAINRFGQVPGQAKREIEVAVVRIAATKGNAEGTDFGSGTLVFTYEIPANGDRHIKDIYRTACVGK